jgi:hypothetical protein
LFVVVLLNEYYSGDQTKKNDIGGACRTCGRRGEVRTGFWWGNMKERDNLEEPGVRRRLILEWISKKRDEST